MTVIKSGDLVMLKSGGPTMTVDTVNTDIFDDNKITGVLCVWFVGDKLERVRFDHRAIEPAAAQKTSPKEKDVRPEEATGEYASVLDEMAAAMNIPADAEQAGSVKRTKPAAATKSAAATKPAAASKPVAASKPAAAPKPAAPSKPAAAIKPAASSKREASAAAPVTEAVRAG